MASAAPLRMRRVLEIHAAHARLRRELVEGVRRCRKIAAAQLILLLGEHHDRAPFGSLVGQRGELRGVSEVAARRRVPHKRCRMAVAERDRAGLVQQQHIDVAGRLDGAPGGGDDVGAHHAIHAGDSDGRQQPADGGGNQAHEQGDQHRDRDHRCRRPKLVTAYWEKGASVAVASRNTSVIIDSRMESAISLGVRRAKPLRPWQSCGRESPRLPGW